MNQRLCGAVLGAGLACAAQAQQLPANVRCVRNGAPAGGDGRSWAAAWPELQEALLTASASGGQITEVWVAQGTYAPPPWNDCAGFPVSGVSLYGGFVGTETSVSQRPSGARTVLSNGLHTCLGLLNIDTTAPVTVDGIEVHYAMTTAIRVAGPCTLENVSVSSSSWSGIVKTDHSPITIHSCHFEGVGFAAGQIISGPGVISDSYLFGSDLAGGTGMSLTDITVRGCTVRAGGDTGALGASRVVFQDSQISAGTGMGPGISGIDVDFDGCAVTSWASLSASIRLTGGSVRRSSLDATADGYPFAAIDLTGVTLNDSSIRTSSDVYVRLHAASTVLNCRFTGGSGAISGGAEAAPRFVNCLFQHGGSPSMFEVGPQWRFDNCIIWGSGTGDPSTFDAPAGMTGFVNYCDVRGWSGALGGVGNISANPFLYADGTLTSASPCIDAGDNSRVPPGAVYDFVRGCRIVDGDANGSRVVDMGPHEFTLCAANCDCSTGSPVLNVLDFNCFLHRFSVGDPWANCDRSTGAPVLNVLDFNCFVQRFTAGCP
jgi:hypothetical protein